MAKGISDAEAERQLSQMINFIQLEAREKAEELRTKADQDYAMERQMREQHAKAKLQVAFAKMEQERITQRRVAMSKELGKHRNERLSQQSKLLDGLVEEADAALLALSTSSPAQYKTLMQRLVTQGALRVIGAGNGGSHSLLVQCREADIAVVNSVLPAAAAEASTAFQAAAAADAARRTSTKEAALGGRLPTAPGSTPAPPALPSVEVKLAVATFRNLPASSAGGVVVFSADGTVVSDNTLQKRLTLAAGGLQPVLRKVVFPSATLAPAAAADGGEEDLLALH